MSKRSAGFILNDYGTFDSRPVGNGLSRDELSRLTENIRDEINGRHDHGSKPGKVVREHHMFKESPKEFTPDELFATMEEAARNGNYQQQFLLGQEYAWRGEIDRARYWLGKAAKVGWPGAAEELAKL